MATAFPTEDNPNGLLLKSICKTLQLNLISGVGVEGCDTLFQEQVMDFFPEYIVKMDKYMPQTPSHQIRNSISKTLNEIIRWLLNTHLPKKQNKLYDKLKLYDSLSEVVFGKVESTVNYLKTFPGAECALPVFIMAASIKLLLLQELALIDPKVKSALDSQHLRGMQNCARRYSEYVETTYDTLVQARMRCVSNIDLWKTKDSSNCSVSWHDEHRFKYYVSSTLLSKVWSNGDPHKLQSEAKQARSKYMYEKLNEIEKELDYPRQTAIAWKTLITDPFPNYRPPPTH